MKLTQQQINKVREGILMYLETPDAAYDKKQYPNHSRAYRRELRRIFNKLNKEYMACIYAVAIHQNMGLGEYVQHDPTMRLLWHSYCDIYNRKRKKPLTLKEEAFDLRIGEIEKMEEDLKEKRLHELIEKAWEDFQRFHHKQVKWRRFWYLLWTWSKEKAEDKLLAWWEKNRMPSYYVD